MKKRSTSLGINEFKILKLRYYFIPTRLTKISLAGTHQIDKGVWNKKCRHCLWECKEPSLF